MQSRSDSVPSYEDDNFLLERIVNGDQTGLRKLYDRYQTVVFGLAFHVLGNREDAEEVTLDVFTKVWEKADVYTAHKANVRTWLTAITRNRAIDLLRRRNIRFTAQSPTWADACLDCMPAPDDQEASLDLAILRKKVADALVQLPSNQREVLALAYFRGLSHSQIAKELAAPLGTVKTRIRSAMRKLRNLIVNDKKKAF